MTPPPTSIDGTDITGATIDGQEVQEITVDGQTVFTAIPDSQNLQAAYDASDLSLSDGDTVTTWPDQSSNGHNLTAGQAPTYTANGINGNDSVRFDGVDDFLDVSFSTISQPHTMFIVAEYLSLPSGEFPFIIDGAGTTEMAILADADDLQYRIDAGDGQIVGTADQDPHIFEVEWDGDNDLVLDGTNLGGGDSGTSSVTGITVGSNGAQFNFGNIDVAEILHYNVGLDSSTKSEVRSFLSDKYGITI